MLVRDNALLQIDHRMWLAGKEWPERASAVVMMTVLKLELWLGRVCMRGNVR